MLDAIEGRILPDASTGSGGFSGGSVQLRFRRRPHGGWIAHAREQQATGRLIKPQFRYVGPVPDLVA
jgi:citrate synthase